ncbi:hybrid sensor histidine kinase/response regulator transcription factor [Bacteroides helcogenes]|uniref:histidine kinase n=1 Tax=Bacteroides helcogenes (strain ATCC 35417 / DSM 20613 / JCM 6297 / CCUG 15421 / P 36-108) TaxID=693979 RepID=E6SR81_BACT6|nr:hybrid sensor histidine kinase/response regulator transcription factor [Bacteroides helcogenes]ADV43025.1 histidine kinase [Bacteroides helcogenes P 36-108]MDY5236930.1 two-component regulator propeller domain-containing protein [Bacteroides helcogenes]
MKRLRLPILLVWMICFSAASQNYMFKHLEVKDGLSNNQINAIYKDADGFMWFGTASGLNRYDGYGFKTYRSRKDDASTLPDNYIEEIQEDASGNLWIRTGAGYAVYNSVSDTFDRDVEAWMWNVGISGTPSMLYIDAEKVCWISVAGKGIYRHKAGAKAADEVRMSPELRSKALITDMTECEEGILIAYGDGTLVCLDKEKPGVKWVNSDIPAQLGKDANNTFDLFADRDGQVWVYSVAGVWVYHLAGKTWKLRSPRNDAYNTVRALAQDKYGCVWVGHDQDGIDVIDRNQKHTRLANDPNNERTLSNNTITVLYEDADGTMWVGTYKKGISYYNESAFKFGIADIGDINCVEDGGNDIVWLGTNGGGLVRWNTVTGDRKVFSHSATSNSLSSDVVVSLLLGSDGRLWAGTFWGGLNCYDGNRFTHYRDEKEGAAPSAYDNVWALAEDVDKNIWMGTLGGGLRCLNPRTGRFTTYSTKNSGLVSDYISSLVIGRDNRLIIGTSVGVAFMDLGTGKIVNFTGTRSGKARFSNQHICQVYEDSRGLLWVATREGLNVYDSGRDELYEVPLKSDFSKMFILGIAEDDRKNIWVSTGGEMINVVLSVEEETGKFSFGCRAYGDKDGLQRCDFNQRSLKRLHTGEIVVGGLYGLNRFRPDNIKYNRSLPKVMFTGFQLFNEDVKVGEEYAGRVILQKALNRVREVVLNYKQNMFTVLFASDNYVLPQKTRYLYKLEGFNEDWLTSTGDMHRVTYTNLAPGTYFLKVKAANSDGYAGKEEACLKIVILPPFWMTPWAYACYIFLLIGGLLLALYAVQRRERNKFKIRQMEQDTLKMEEINQMKFRFFTNVSHELRTPLTLIISPLESMIKETAEEKMLDRLKMMHRNALRLLNLVNQLLDFRKNEMAGLHLTLSEGDVVAYVQNICNSFLMLSEKKNIHLTFFSAVESLNMAFDEDKVGKIVMNLLSNAFKFTPEGGRVDVSLELLRGADETLEIKVSDTGIGIKEEDKGRIFERFFQIEHKATNRLSTGSGIGLSLVRDFVTLHGGAVRVFDNAGSGSVFVVDIPVKHSEVRVATPLSEEAVEEDVAALAPPEGGTAGGGALSGDRKKPLVLVVDDNGDFIDFMKDSLSLYFSVQSAPDGAEAWKVIPELMPDLIVSDLMMPEMDGNELCRRVRADKRTANIPFVLLTAKQSVENKVEGLTIGADDYVTKPFNVEVLILRMRKLIDLSGRSKLRTRIDPEPSEIAITSLDEKLIGNAIKYVEENIARSDLSVEELSHELGMSRVHLYKKLLQITGKTPIEFIRVIRLKRAAQLLRESQQNVSEIAYQLGFNNPKYFSKYFKDEFGVLPSVYQEREGNNKRYL